MVDNSQIDIKLPRKGRVWLVLGVVIGLSLTLAAFVLDEKWLLDTRAFTSCGLES